MPKVSQNMGHDHCGKGVEEGRQNIWGVPQTAGRPHGVRIRGHVREECAFSVTESGTEPAEGRAGR